MARMMKHQMDHCEAKIREITWKLIGEKPTYKDAYLTDTELVGDHLSGQRKITPAVFNKSSRRFQEVHRAPGYGHLTLTQALGQVVTDADNSTAKKKYVKDLDQYKKREDKIHAQASKVLDEIILGGEVGALIALQAFANMKV